MLTKRILSFLGALAITAALTFAVVTFAPEASFTAGTLQEGICYEVSGVSPDAVVATAAGKGATADLAAYWMCYNASYLDSYMQYYGASLDWDAEVGEGSTVRDYIAQDALDALRQQLVIESLAEKYNVGLTDAQRAAMDESAAGFIEQYGSEEAYEAEIAKLGMTRTTYERVTSLNYLYQNLYTLYMTEGSALYASADELADYAASLSYISADHILLRTKDTETGEALSDEEIAAQREKAEALLADLKAYTGDDLIAHFSSLADENSEDSGRTSFPTGYTFTVGDMVDAFEEAAYALSEGELSEIVESPYGFHIILRLPLDRASAAESVRSDYFAEAVSAATDATEIRTSEDYAKLEPQALYEAMLAAQQG